MNLQQELNTISIIMNGKQRVEGCKKPFTHKKAIYPQQQVYTCELPLSMRKFRKESKQIRSKRTAKLNKIRNQKQIDVTKQPKQIKVVNPGVKVKYCGFRKLGRKNNTRKITSNQPIEGQIDSKGRIVEFGKDCRYYNDLVYKTNKVEGDLETCKSIEQMEPSLLLELLGCA